MRSPRRPWAAALKTAMPNIRRVLLFRVCLGLLLEWCSTSTAFHSTRWDAEAPHVGPHLLGAGRQPAQRFFVHERSACGQTERLRDVACHERRAFPGRPDDPCSKLAAISMSSCSQVVDWKAADSLGLHALKAVLAAS